MGMSLVWVSIRMVMNHRVVNRLLWRWWRGMVVSIIMMIIRMARRRAYNRR